MEPLTAIGLAGNIITFIDFSYKVISGLNKGLDVASGMTSGNASLDHLMKDLSAITQALISDAPPRTENEKQMHSLATNCHSLSEDLVEILHSLRVGDKKSKWKSVGVKWRSMRKEKDIEALERRLNGYQSEILLRLQVMFKYVCQPRPMVCWLTSNRHQSDFQASLVQDHLDGLRSEGQALHNETTAQLSTLQREISDLVQIMSSSPPSPQTRRGQPRVLEDSPEELPLAKLGDYMSKLKVMAKSFSRENYILGQLVFPSMYRRGDLIEHAESGTFGWMVEVPENKNGQPNEEAELDMSKSKLEFKGEAEQEAMRENTRESFVTWLKSGRHIFHISGKAGAGKSTLMKFLGNSARVKEELNIWAGSQPLIFARFFFWNSGDELQMSLEGLYRSLLFEVCRQFPASIPLIFPDLWEGLLSGFVPPQQTPLQIDEVKIAFNRLIQKSDTMNSRICFFIDGLDELQGDDVDHWRIARDLQSWTQSKNIKLCVSSRPHTPFLQTFSGPENVQISIHELTRVDIRQFCLAMFEKDTNFGRVESSYKKLVHRIVWNSDGVFLWARVVVRILLGKIGFRSTTKDLRETLVSMPKDLNGLFDRILGSTHPDDQKLSDTLFLLTTANFTTQKPPVQNAISYSWLEDLEDPDFPWNTLMTSCSVEEIKERLQRVSCLLDRLTRGLLEVVPHRRRAVSQGHEYFSSNVQFFHRTARDYIAQTRQAEMRQRVPDLDIYDGNVRLQLAELHFSRPTPSDTMLHEAPWQGPITVSTHACVATLAEAKKDGYIVPSRLLGGLRRIIEGHIQPGKSLESQPGYDSKFYLRGINTSFNSDGFLRIKKSHRPASYLSFVIAGGLYGLLPPEEKAPREDRGNRGSQSEPNPLLVAVTYRNVGIPAVRELLSEGWSPEETIRIEKPSSHANGVDCYQGESPSMPVSIWLVYLYEFAWSGIISGFRYGPDGIVLEKLLRFGVDRDVQFIIRGRATSAYECAGEKFTLTLMEVLEISSPSNIDNIRTMLKNTATQNTTTQRSQLGSGPVSVSSSSSSYSAFLRRYKKLTSGADTGGRDKLSSEFMLESVVTPSERLDIPFRYQSR